MSKLWFIHLILIGKWEQGDHRTKNIRILYLITLYNPSFETSAWHRAIAKFWWSWNSWKSLPRTINNVSEGPVRLPAVWLVPGHILGVAVRISYPHPPRLKHAGACKLWMSPTMAAGTLRLLTRVAPSTQTVVHWEWSATTKQNTTWLQVLSCAPHAIQNDTSNASEKYSGRVAAKP